MANNKIKGLTVEIGGDTTKLGKALEDVTKKSQDIGSELGQINKLLKLDPGNTELLSQKQKVLASAIANTADKLDTLKEAEKQVQKQFQKGEATEEQVRALQREIIATEKQMAKYEQEAKETGDQLKKFGKNTDDATKSTNKFGDTVSKIGSVAVKGFAAVTAAVAAAGGALAAAAESSREYRNEMAKLDTAFTTSGHKSEAATATYKALQGVLGETDRAVEAANHLALLTDNEKELQKWTDICTGVYATFGASLPIEGLTEAANETAKVGQVTGPLADALNWAGVSEDAFNESLAACTSEQERQTLIMQTLSGLYSDAATQYKKNNEEVIRANQANEAWASSLAEVGAEVEPLLTGVKTLGASMLSDLLPGIKDVTGAFGEMLAGGENAAEGLGTAVGGMFTDLINKAVDLIPAIVNTGVSLVTSTAQAIVKELPNLVKSIAKVLIDCTPVLIDGAVTLLLAIVDAIDQILPPLIKAVPGIVMTIVNALLDRVPDLIDGALTLLLAICDAIPLLVKELVPLIPSIVIAIGNALLKCTPQLLSAAVTLMGALAKAIPNACSQLLKALPQIWTTMSSYLKQLPSKVVSVGKDIVAGLWKGMTERVTWLKNKIKGWVGDVTKFLKKLFGINSPSKVTAYMGEMLDEGFAKGIKDNTQAPLDAMSDLSDDLIHEAGNVDGVAIERQFTHAYSISAAAEMQQQAGLLGKLDKILAAIERGQILTIDGNALVGATANTMNSALGQRRVLAGRGAV